MKNTLIILLAVILYIERFVYGYLIPFINAHEYMSAIYTYAIPLLVPILLAIILVKKNKKIFSSYGDLKENSVHLVLVPFLLTIVSWSLEVVSQSIITFNYLQTKDTVLVKCSYGIYLFLFASSTIGEELFFRGYLFYVIKKYTNSRIIIILIASLAYSTVHWDYGIRTVFVRFVEGFIIGSYYYKYEKITPLLIWHISYNLLYEYFSW